MNKNSRAEGYLLSKGHSYYAFFLLFLLYMFDFIDRMVVVSLFPYLKRDWGLTDTHCGLLVSAVYWSIVILSLPISVLIDRWSRKKCIGIMAIVWSLATAVCALTRNFGQLFAARSAIGIGEAGYAPGGTAMIAALFPESRRSMMVGIWNASIPLGSALGIIIGGMIAATFGWRYAFGIVALPGFIVALLFFFVRDYQTVDLLKSKPETGEKQTHRMNLKDIWQTFASTPSLITTYLAFAGNMFLVSAYMSWLPSYFYRTEGISMEKAALKGSMIMVLAIVGSPLGGFLADKWLKRRVNARLLFPACSSIITAAIFFSAFRLFTGTTQYIMLLLGGVAASSFAPAAIAVTQDVIHPGLRATSYSFCVIAQNLLGSSLGPLFVGIISDQYGLKTALTLVPIVAVFSSMLFLTGSRFYEKDRLKVEKIDLRFEPPPAVPETILKPIEEYRQ